MTIAADSMEADTVEVVKQNAVKEVARATARATARAIGTWMRDVRKLAQQAAADSKMNEAEELYLQLIALGIPADDQLKRFFKARYGQNLEEIFNPLSVVLGHDLVIDREAQKRRKRRFPSKMPSAGKFPKKKMKPAPKPVADVAAEAKPAEEVAAEAPAEAVAAPTNEVDDAFDSALGSDEDDAPEEDFGSVDEILEAKDKAKSEKAPKAKKAPAKKAPKKDGEAKKDEAKKDESSEDAK